MTNNLNNPKEIIQIEGKNRVTDFYKTSFFNPEFKTERDLRLVDTDSYVSVFNQLTIPVRKITVEAPIFNPVIELPYVNKIRITRFEDAPATGTIENEHYIEGFSILNFPQSYGSRISNVEVCTTSTEVKQINVRIYGWED